MKSSAAASFARMRKSVFLHTQQRDGSKNRSRVRTQTRLNQFGNTDGSGRAGHAHMKRRPQFLVGEFCLNFSHLQMHKLFCVILNVATMLCKIIANACGHSGETRRFTLAFGNFYCFNRAECGERLAHMKDKKFHQQLLQRSRRP